MTKQENIENWLSLANDDLRSAEVLYNEGLWLNVAFHCQQAIEKSCKGLYIYFVDNNYPYSHDIKEILLKFESYLPVQIPNHIYDSVDELSAYHIKGRYASFKQRLNMKLNKEKNLKYFINN
ncbi:MAG: HEPN domain-containing protein [Elusimicrobiota bacterium]|nr:HEPN domain-containing protein [Elusimicrobiota bacterium]